ncbi:endoribonuclease L-PSP [Parabacteroides bouchesdurhonensis]|uniref:chorismate transformation enzyme, FkbO/Hyg5 family n=1 Tax=Parabacteroides bouchesdurhonensis TaxID=1936995 RepID=UPI000C83EE6C|nr:endoribonuclease L-PSP [Parabacteroides bouchesdurhonensis]
MNYCEKIQYKIYTTGFAGFPEMVDQLLAQLPEDEIIIRLCFFGTPSSNKEYISRYAVLREKIRKCYGNNEPALSYVSQPPLNASLVMEVHSYRPESDDHIRFRKMGEMSYVVLENGCGRFLFAGGFQGDVVNCGIEQQSVDIFHSVSNVLKEEGFPINSIVRQWNYIELITGFDKEDQHYQTFNNARSEFYAKTNWTNGYPAATGIGTNMGGVLVDLDAAVFTNSTCFATPIDNKLQIAAHAYSDKVLDVSQSKKTTPKFERAKSITCGKNRLVYISGTAAIRGEESLEGVGLERQLRITMENIDQLLDGAKLSILRVYLKDKSYYEEAWKLMESYQLDIPVSYMCADVCRNELLIEIEGIAVQ